MKRFYLLRISCIVTSFILSLFATTASPAWQVTIMLTSTAILLFGFMYELYTNYSTGEEQKLRVAFREIIPFGIVFFVGSIIMKWLFGKVIALNNLYATVDLLNTTMFYLYIYYIANTNFESRKNQTQEKQ